MHSIISLIMAAVLLFTAADHSSGGTESWLGTERPAGRESAADVLLPPAEQDAAAPDRSAVAWADMAYSHYDPAWFYEQTDKLERLGREGRTEAALELYDQLQEELLRIDTLGAIAYIHYSCDVTDPYWTEEHIYCDELMTQASDALSIACGALTQGDTNSSFVSHVGAETAAQYAGYEPMTDRESELQDRESELVDQYNTLMSRSDELTYSYMGETWTWDKIIGFAGTSLAYRDYDGYLEIYYGLQKALNDQVGPIFTELVQLRTELARIEGYDSYAQLAYKEIYRRDYGLEEAQMLCDAAKPIAQTYYDSLYNNILIAYNNAPSTMDGDELVQALGRFAGRLDPSLAESWQFMTDLGLYNVDGGEGRIAGSYTIPLNAYDSAFIFAQLEGDCYDFSTLAHEFGHFTYHYYHPSPDPLLQDGCFDLMEMHSTGLEALFTAYYDELYPDCAEAAEYAVLGDLLNGLTEGCVYDEFLRRVYAEPDMTLDEINRLFASLRMEYGLGEAYDVDYTWMYVPHNFESPFYYLSYAVSALGAMQIWELSQNDWQSGVDAWLQLMNADVYDRGYMTVMPACGLRVFSEAGAVEDICRPFLEALDRLHAGV